MKKLIAVILISLMATFSSAQSVVKITDLPEDTTPASTDLLPTIKNPGTTPVNRKVKIGNITDALNNASYADKGIASFDENFFSISSGHVSMLNWVNPGNINWSDVNWTELFTEYGGTNWADIGGNPEDSAALSAYILSLIAGNEGTVNWADIGGDPADSASLTNWVIAMLGGLNGEVNWEDIGGDPYDSASLVNWVRGEITWDNLSGAPADSEALVAYLAALLAGKEDTLPLTPASTDCSYGLDSTGTLGCYPGVAELYDNMNWVDNDNTAKILHVELSNLTEGYREIFAPEVGGNWAVTDGTIPDGHYWISDSSGRAVDGGTGGAVNWDELPLVAQNQINWIDVQENGEALNWIDVFQIPIGGTTIDDGTILASKINWADWETAGPINESAINWLSIQANDDDVNWLEIFPELAGGGGGGGAVNWGDILGTVTAQTDLVNWVDTEILSLRPVQLGGNECFIGYDSAGNYACYSYTELKSGLKIVDPTDTTKALSFDVSGITTATTRTVTARNSSGTMAYQAMTTLGDIQYGGASGAETRLAGNTTTNRLPLTQRGDGANSAAPTWGAIYDAGINWIDVQGNTNLRIPTAADPDIAVEGKLAWDNNNDWLRGHDGTNQTVVGEAIKKFQKVIAKPLAYIGNTRIPFFQNLTDGIITITRIRASGSASSSFSLKRAGALADGAGVNWADVVEMEPIDMTTLSTMGGLNWYDANIASGINMATLNPGEMAFINWTGVGDPNDVQLGIDYWINANVN